MCLHCPPLALHAQQIPRTAHRFFMLPLGWLALRLDKTAITTALLSSPHSSRFHQWLFQSLQGVQGWLLLSLQANQKYFSG